MNILMEDEYFLAVEKPAKQFVHPMPGERESKDCLLFNVRDHINCHAYAINRLDRPVSGIVLFAKNPEVVTAFQNIWHDDTTHKKYLCLHRGKLETAGFFDSPLSKKGAYKSRDNKELKQEALTLYQAIEHFPHEFCTYTQVEIKTGRYHQIRRHFRKAIMPIIGDRKHGKGVVNKHFEDKYSLDQIFLHCHELSLVHPYTDKKIYITNALPDNLKAVLKKIGLTNFNIS